MSVQKAASTILKIFKQLFGIFFGHPIFFFSSLAIAMGARAAVEDMIATLNI